jgi:hypothetical protein
MHVLATMLFNVVKQIEDLVDDDGIVQITEAIRRTAVRLRMYKGYAPLVGNQTQTGLRVLCGVIWAVVSEVERMDPALVGEADHLKRCLRELQPFLSAAELNRDFGI